ncbi:S-layer family protein [Alkalinema sp. FACHB-956]|uniref:two-partner secretion domain-containing protein n=1 Tax=Alkalinema sp. FACHB-956 TaxID=2692768 RepID=UPI0016826EC4|nr:S-layer family protein [Alkalinema sp. FACHB-956]MBD2329148.1 S-layer family protein [Alkalinema sp. FACHB-956]
MQVPIWFPKYFWKSLVFPMALGAWMQMGTSGWAQVIPDNSLPVNSIVPGGCITCTITGGTQAGSNLFHSFTQFSVPTGGSAFFDNAPTVNNIFARVTGSTASTIDGILKANGSANLFLINPNGLTFGSGATLQLGGSFVGSTAASIRFQDGTEFSALAPQVKPLLTISAPVGLQSGASPGPIQVNGSGNNLKLGSSFSINRSARPTGLAVQPGQTLALLGGDVTLQGGNLTSDRGRIEIGSVQGNQFVSLTPTNPGWMLGYESASAFGDIRLLQAASIDTSSTSAGNGAIKIQGRSLQIRDGSALLGITLNNGKGQPITINTTDRIQVLGSQGQTASTLFPSMILTDPGLNATATTQGGSINLTTGTLEAIGGGFISASTLAAGAAGNITVQARQVNLKGEIPAVSVQSGLFSQVLNRTARGNAGTISIATDTLNVSDGAQVFASTAGLGQGGILNVKASSVNLSGTGVNRPSGLLASGAGGNGGPITVETGQLTITGGAQINSSTIGPGRGGEIFLQATDTRITGGATIGPSGVFSTVSGRGSGKGGQITISGDRLFLGDGAQIATATGWVGDAGDILINVGQVELAGQDPARVGGLISTSVLQPPPPNIVTPLPATTGAGGTITLNVDRLVVRNGAVINVSNFPTSTQSTARPGNGPVGNIQIQANSILLNNGGTLNAASRGGDRGNIVINSSNNVTLRNRSLITTNATGSATGGNILISTPFLVGPALENSDITANASSNFGGRIEINAQNVLGLRPSLQLTPQSDITAISNLGLQFNGEVVINNLQADPDSGTPPLATDLLDQAQKITQTCGFSRNSRFVITGRGGMPLQPTEQVSFPLIWQDLQDFEPQNIATTTQVPTWTQPIRSAQATAPPTSQPHTRSSGATTLMQAVGWVRNAQGQVQLVAPTPDDPAPLATALPFTCAMSP